MDIARAIKSKMIEKNISQAELSRNTGMSTPYISMLVNGKIPDPKASNVYRIARALDVSLDNLLALADSYEQEV